jgi:acyl-CoA reductase-like NAD-dependent aldehyde dehydrogenase
MATDFLDGMRTAQQAWARKPVRDRVAVIAEARKRMASDAQSLAESVPVALPGALHRSVADTLVAEVLPLIDACRFVEREAVSILKTRKLGRKGRPIWLSGVEAEVERVPWGIVLVIGAANYPLLLSGVQAIQALVAGNAVILKPAPGTESSAKAFCEILRTCGVDEPLFAVPDSSKEAARDVIERGVDHVVLTGSAETGHAVLRQLSETLTPATLELSGCDAAFVLAGADLRRTLKVLEFWLRFNGSATCMAPRRLFLVGFDASGADDFERNLCESLVDAAPVPLPPRTRALLAELIADARLRGADILLNGLWGELDSAASVTLIARANPTMLAMQSDIFAPILSVMRAVDIDEALTAHAACPYGLSASVFGLEREAKALAAHLRVGNVVINDLIAPTADPRIPFGGRGRSGFGVTRGREGLLSMTTPRTIQLQKSKSLRMYEATGKQHPALFAGLAEMLHGRGIRERWRGLKRVLRAARELK